MGSASSAPLQESPKHPTLRRIDATIPVFIDDLLHAGSHKDVTTAPPTRCSPSLRTLVEKYIKANARAWQADVIPFILPSEFEASAVKVQTQVESWKPEWRADGVMVWHLTWRMTAAAEVSTPSLQRDLRAQVRGGVLDGWGEGVQQASRFGPLCVYDDDTDTHRPASPQEVRSGKLATFENGRYAVLLTVKGATFRVLANKAERVQTAKPRLARPSPTVSATLFQAGTKKRGNDGRTWVVKENARGGRRWVPVPR